MILQTSNINKLKEFQRILPGLQSEKGKDLKEVQGTMNEVIIYKSLEAGKGIIVEDTILIVDGEEIVDIRWKIDSLTTTSDIRWIVSLGYNDGKSIKVYRGIIDGNLVKTDKEGFGFDPYFIPNGTDLSLQELTELNQKDKYSARNIALINLKNKKFTKKIRVKDVPVWTGKYQNEEV